MDSFVFSLFTVGVEFGWALEVLFSPSAATTYKFIFYRGRCGQPRGYCSCLVIVETCAYRADALCEVGSVAAACFETEIETTTTAAPLANYSGTVYYVSNAGFGARRCPAVSC